MPLLYAISSGIGWQGLAALVRAAEAGVDWIQIREKQLPARELMAFGRKLRSSTSHTPVKILLNERFDLALAAGLDGVHLPSSGLAPAQVRRAAPAGFLIGLSCHATAEVAAAAGADFCVLGPIFPTPSKSAAPPLGLAALAAASRASCPVLALGGVGWVNAPACLAQGAAGIAGIRLFGEEPARWQLRTIGRELRHDDPAADSAPPQ